MRLVEWDNLPQHRDDINRKFVGTYVKAIVPELGRTPVVIGIDEIDIDHARIRHANPELPPMWLEAHVEWQSINVIEAFPPIGVIQNEGNILIVRRNGARQWQVGFCSHNAIVRDAALTPLRVTQSVALAAFSSPKYFGTSVEEAEKWLASDRHRLAVALTPVYWLKKSNNGSVLFQRDKPLGTFSFGKFFINNACSDLKQELWDSFRIKS